jgi:hypothetical protein
MYGDWGSAEYGLRHWEAGRFGEKMPRGGIPHDGDRAVQAGAHPASRPRASYARPLAIVLQMIGQRVHESENRDGQLRGHERCECEPTHSQTGD